MSTHGSRGVHSCTPDSSGVQLVQAWDASQPAYVQMAWEIAVGSCWAFLHMAFVQAWRGCVGIVAVTAELP
jgi:hypothetical protein